MSTLHTPEPWPEFEKHGNPCRTNIGDLYAVRLSRDDYNHARSCVNACAGFTSEGLKQCLAEGDTILKRLEQWQLACIKAEQQRDELLELLCEARDRMLGSHAPMVRLRERTDALIAKAKGKQQ